MGPSKKPLADQARNRQLGTGCLRLFFVPFFLAGAAMLYGFTIRPALRILAAQDWTPTPCVIAASELRAHSGDSTTYSIEVRYQYDFDNRSYSSSRYGFSVTNSSSGRQAKQAVVDQLPPGTETICYVNPAHPEEAVLHRGWNWELLFFGGFASIFVLIGGLGIVFAGRLTHSKDPLASVRSAIPPSGGPAVLQPRYTPMAKFVGLLITALVWNGFVGGFVYLVFFSEDQHAPFFAKFVVGVFALIGLLIVVGALRSLLALFSPRIQLTAPATTVPLGGELPFTWTVSGRSGMLSKLRVILEGREEAVYRRGTSTSTDTRVFATITVFETSEREFLSQGAARAVVPPNLMHTFEARHNKILWRLRVLGEIPRWPDVDDEYPITILPQPPQR